MKPKGTQFDPVYESEHGSARVSPAGYVSNVHIQESHRGTGEGTKLMQQITSHADLLGHALTLHAREALHPWYQRLGFEHAGEDVIGPRMVRNPR